MRTKISTWLNRPRVALAVGLDQADEEAGHDRAEDRAEAADHDDGEQDDDEDAAHVGVDRRGTGRRSTPASPASAMPKPNTGVTQRPTLMPRARERSASSVEARTIMPTRVLVSSSQTRDADERARRRPRRPGRSTGRHRPIVDPALEPGGQLVRQRRDAVAALDQVDEHQREAEGQQEVVERVEPEQPAARAAAPSARRTRTSATGTISRADPEAEAELRRAGPPRRPRRACSRRRG